MEISPEKVRNRFGGPGRRVKALMTVRHPGTRGARRLIGTAPGNTRVCSNSRAAEG